MAINQYTQKCIVCKKKDKRLGSLFCTDCKDKDVFVKIRAFGNSKEFKDGFYQDGHRMGRLPRR